MMNERALTHNLSVVQELQPSLLWRWFAHIASIPHPSHHEEELANFIVDWAKERDLSVCRDEVGNIIIKKPATQGMEHRTPIALQAHLDMVPQANNDTPHDFTKDPLRLRQSEDGKWLLATGTTLGADNGIGMASCLAVLESDLPHPELEVLLTMTEETGMVGAFGLQPDTLTAKAMINTDSEQIGEVYVGCAGGITCEVSLALDYVAGDFERACQISITGLHGGHSGLDIHKHRASAINLTAQLLMMAKMSGGRFSLSSLSGGTLKNAIAREATAIISYDKADEATILNALHQEAENLLADYADSETRLIIDITPTQLPIRTLSLDSTHQALALLSTVSAPVVRYHKVMTDTVETSASCGVVRMGESLAVGILVRSLSEAKKMRLANIITSRASLLGASVHTHDNYVGWDINPTSAITEVTQAVYADVLGEKPAIKVMHAGLECGLFKQSHPHLDMVSIGPTILNAHSPDEKVDIDSVAVYWQVLTGVLANSPKI